jgi:asparagine synthase (glutamine-hydrolysing)
MCGIFGGVVERSRFNNLDTEIFKSTLAHRGPDDSGLSVASFEQNKLFLGHTRLSIIDLTAAGRQPFSSECGQIELTYNGEVYNYVELRKVLQGLSYEFSTETDTEVVLKAWMAWGTDCFRKFQGMFSIALVDKIQGKLFLARDAFGIKPLFYTKNIEDLFFASEVAPLLRVNKNLKEIDELVIEKYLFTGLYDQEQKTFFKNIASVKPGSYIEIDLSTNIKTMVSWWKPNFDEIGVKTLDEAKEEIRDCFLKNVNSHMRSDVPIAFALSGGLDSSAIVCAARYLFPEKKITTFTFVAEEREINESAWASKIADFVGSEHHEIRIDEVTLKEDLDALIVNQGEPFGSTSIYAQSLVFSKMRKEGFIVSLDGQGADELLAGYRGYPVQRVRSMIENKTYFSAFQFLMKWTQWPGRSKLDAIKIAVVASFPSFTSLMSTVISNNGARLCQNDNSSQFKKYDYKFDSEQYQGRRVIEALYQAISGFGLQALLRHADRNSMSCSLESRTPFLTTDFAEKILSLPENFLISNDGETKHILREALGGIVPDEILYRKDKIGFQADESKLINKLLSSEKFSIQILGQFDWLDLKKLERMLHDTNSSATLDKHFKWRVYNLSRWLQLLNLRGAY